MKTNKETANNLQDIKLSKLNKKIKKAKIYKNELAEILGVNRNTLARYFSLKTNMPLVIYLQIKSILKGRKTQ